MFFTGKYQARPWGYAGIYEHPHGTSAADDVRGNRSIF